MAAPVSDAAVGPARYARQSRQCSTTRTIRQHDYITMRPLLGQNSDGEGAFDGEIWRKMGFWGGKCDILTKNVLYRLSYVGRSELKSISYILLHSDQHRNQS